MSFKFNPFIGNFDSDSVSGDVSGPASSTDLDIAVFDGITGKLIKDGGKTVAQVLDRSNHTGTQPASTISDFDTEVSNNSDVSSNTSARHTHANKALLDTYDQTNADLADAVSKKHTHSNKSILDATEESFTTALKGNYDAAYSHSQLTSGNPHNVAKADVGLGNVTNDAQIPLSQKGVAGGVAELDSNGIVPSSQLPSYVDDVLEFTDLASFPATGETGKIYVAKDTNKTYRWGGSSYVEISASLALGETSDTAYRGDRGKIAYDHSQLTSGNPHQVTLADVGGTTDHTQLTNIGTNTHAQIDDHIASTSNPHSVTASQVGAYSTSETDNLLSGKEDKSNKVASFQATPDDTHYPSEKLVKDSLDGKSNVGHTHTSSDVTDLTSTLDPRYVNVSGDTMTGLLTLSGDPSNNLHAATKQYVDNIRDIDGGTFFDTYIATNDVDGGIF